MAYVDLNKRRQTKNKLNREDYAAMKADPVLNDYLLEKERNRKRARTRKRQDQKIREASIRIAERYGYSWKECQVFHAHFTLTATVVLYPERLLK